MDSSSIVISLHHKKQIQIERSPKLLKDYLSEISNSCSSSGFKAFPRHQQPPPSSIFDNYNNNKNKRGKITIQSFIKAVKNFPFTTVKKTPYSFLPRTLSRKLTRKETLAKKSTVKEVKISVRVKDILRWRSFRDVAAEESPPSDSDLSPSPNHYDATTTTGSVDSSRNSTAKRSSNFSWCESDFTAEILPCWSGKILDEKELVEEDGKKDLPRVGVDFVEATIDSPRVPLDEDDSPYDEEEDEIQSPISVFDFDSRENEEPFVTTFDQSLANVERSRQNLIEKIKEFESLSNLNSANFEKWTSIEYMSGIDEKDKEEEGRESENYSKYEKEENEEEKAREFLVYVKATSSKKTYRSEDDKLLFDFFRDELKNQTAHNYDSEMVALAKAWVSGDCGAFEFEHCNKEAYLREINKVGNWTKFEVELQELAMEIGDEILGDLVDELLF